MQKYLRKYARHLTQLGYTLRMNDALIIVYTGDGKGKTSASLGAICRTLGYGKKAALLQFLKGSMKSGEREFFSSLGVFVSAFGEGFFRNESEREKQSSLAQNGMKEAERIIRLDYSLIVLDEINTAVSLKLITEESVLALLEMRGNTNIILTGRNAPQSFIKKADIVSRIDMIKHCYNEGQSAKEGIDF